MVYFLRKCHIVALDEGEVQIQVASVLIRVPNVTSTYPYAAIPNFLPVQLAPHTDTQPFLGHFGSGTQTSKQPSLTQQAQAHSYHFPHY